MGWERQDNQYKAPVSCIFTVWLQTFSYPITASHVYQEATVCQILD